MNEFYIILTGCLVACSCSLLGCFLILRKMSLVGDAISHAVLPGIVIAFMLSGSRETIPMLIGAGLLGLVTTFLIEFFHRKAGLQEDASIGVTFTCLFAVGVILISMYASKVDLDQDCVLYGEIAYVGLGVVGIPSIIYILGVIFCLIVLFIYFFYKHLFITTFDPAYASAIGVSVTVWHYSLMGMVSLTTVASFESVGSILVVAFLVIPPATAYLLTNKLITMMGIACLIGILSCIAGFYLAYTINGSIAAAMATVAGLFFILALLLNKQGVLRKAIA